MKITRTSMLSGITRTLDLAISEEQLNAWLEGRALVQDAFPHLSPSEREFLLTGTTDEEWHDAFPDDEAEIYEDDDLVDVRHLL